MAIPVQSVGRDRSDTAAVVEHFHLLVANRCVNPTNPINRSGTGILS